MFQADDSETQGSRSASPKQNVQKCLSKVDDAHRNFKKQQGM